MEVLAGVFSGVESREREAVVDAERRAAEAVAEQGTASETRDAAGQKVAARKEGRDAAGALLKDANDAVAAANESLSVELKREESLKVEYASAVEARAAHEALLADAWVPLKAGIAPKQWRERNKMLTSIMSAAEELGFEASLLRALPIALKGKTDERGGFVSKTIDYCDGSLNKHLASLTEKVNRHDAEVVKRSEAVAAARATLKEAETARDQRMNDLVVAENALVEAEAGLLAAEKNLEALCLKQKDLAQWVERTKANLASVDALMSNFQALRKSGIPTECEGKDISSIQDAPVAPASA